MKLVKHETDPLPPASVEQTSEEQLADAGRAWQQLKRRLSDLHAAIEVKRAEIEMLAEAALDNESARSKSRQSRVDLGELQIDVENAELAIKRAAARVTTLTNQCQREADEARRAALVAAIEPRFEELTTAYRDCLSGLAAAVNAFCRIAAAEKQINASELHSLGQQRARFNDDARTAYDKFVAEIGGSEKLTGRWGTLNGPDWLKLLHPLQAI